MNIEKKIVFLTGLGRSGTTLLQSMLHAHPEINFSPETHFFKRYILPFMVRRKKADKEEMILDPYLKRLSEERRRKLFDITLNKEGDYRKAMLAIINNPFRSVQYLGDKDTEYVRYFPHLHKLFPAAVMIHIHRDPRDVVASRLKTSWGKKRPFHFHVAEYQYYIEKIRREGPALFGERYLEISYEQLLEQPEVALQKILDVLALEFHPQMLEYYRHADELVSAEEQSWKSEVAKPLKADNSQKWKKSMSPEKAYLIQEGIEDFFREKDYKLLKGQPSFTDKLKLKLFRQLFIVKTFKEKLR